MNGRGDFLQIVVSQGTGSPAFHLFKVIFGPDEDYIPRTFFHIEGLHIDEKLCVQDLLKQLGETNLFILLDMLLYHIFQYKIPLVNIDLLKKRFKRVVKLQKSLQSNKIKKAKKVTKKVRKQIKSNQRWIGKNELKTK